MKKASTEGFTLIELLIVITIIGILAVAFLPTLLGAPSRGRDTQRVADLQKIQKVLINADLANTAYPIALGGACIPTALGATYTTDLGGVIPSDPQAENSSSAFTGAPVNCPGNYFYKSTVGGFAFALAAKVENAETGNTTCAKAAAGEISETGAGNDCYAILTQ